MDRITLEEIKRDIAARLDYAAAFPDLNPRTTPNSQTWQMDCPFCGHKGELFAYKNSGYIKCNRGNNCGEITSLPDFFMSRKGLDPNDTAVFFEEALPELARLAGITLPADTDTGEHRKRYAQERAEKALFDKVLDFFARALWSPEGEETRAYLHGRGYTDDTIRSMGIGRFPGFKETRAFLDGEGVEGTPAFLEYMKSRTDHAAVWPYRDHRGKPVALWGRLTRPLAEGEDANRKYLPFGPAEGTKGLYPFALDRCNPKADHLVAVEGYLDALHAHARGFDNVFALGGSSLTAGHVETLQKWGKVKRITLALDRDTAGLKGTEEAVTRLLAAGFTPLVAELPKGKDPDDVLREDPEAFREYLAHSELGTVWKSRAILDRHDLKNTLGREKALDEVFAFSESCPTPKTAEEATRPLTEHRDLEGYDVDTIDAERQLRRARRLAEAEDRMIQQTIREAQGQPTSVALKKMRDALDRIGKAQEGRTIELPGPYALDDYLEDIRNTPDGLVSGLPILDKNKIQIPRGALTVIAGRPGHGKTTVMLNLLVNLAERYPEQKFLFFSFEEARKRLFPKVMSIVADRSASDCRDYLRDRMFGIDETGLKAGIDRTQELMGTGRITLAYDDGMTAQRLATIVKRAAQEGDIGAVFVDYIQKVPSHPDYRTNTRQVQIQNTCETLRGLAVDTDIPLIVGAQFNREALRGKEKDLEAGKCVFSRLHQLREAGDIEQDVNLALAIATPAKDVIKTEEDEGPHIAFASDSTLDMHLAVIKNRDGETPSRSERMTFGDQSLKLFSPDIEANRPSENSEIHRKTPCTMGTVGVKKGDLL